MGLWTTSLRRGNCPLPCSHPAAGAPGAVCPPWAPTDPYVRESRIRLLSSWTPCGPVGGENGVEHTPSPSGKGKSQGDHLVLDSSQAAGAALKARREDRAESRWLDARSRAGPGEYVRSAPLLHAGPIGGLACSGTIAAISTRTRGKPPGPSRLSPSTQALVSSQPQGARIARRRSGFDNPTTSS